MSMQLKIDNCFRKIDKNKKSRKIQKNDMNIKEEKKELAIKDEIQILEVKEKISKVDGIDLSNRPSNLEIKSRLKYLNVSNGSIASVLHDETGKSITNDINSNASNPNANATSNPISISKGVVIMDTQNEPTKIITKPQNSAKENHIYFGKIKAIEHFSESYFE